MSIATRILRPDRLEESTPAAPAGIRSSWRVKRVAAELDMDASQVRKLVKGHKLEGHIVGKRGVRIYVDSIVAYQQSRQTGGAPELVEKRRPRLSPNAARVKAAFGSLRALGCL